MKENSIKAGELRKYQYRGRHNRRNRIFTGKSKRVSQYINVLAVKKSLAVLHGFDMLIQKVRLASMNLPEYLSGGDSVDLPEIVGHDGMPEFISNPVS